MAAAPGVAGLHRAGAARDPAAAGAAAAAAAVRAPRPWVARASAPVRVAAAPAAAGHRRAGAARGRAVGSRAEPVPPAASAVSEAADPLDVGLGVAAQPAVRAEAGRVGGARRGRPGAAVQVAPLAAALQGLSAGFPVPVFRRGSRDRTAGSRGRPAGSRGPAAPGCRGARDEARASPGVTVAARPHRPWWRDGPPAAATPGCGPAVRRVSPRRAGGPDRAARRARAP